MRINQQEYEIVPVSRLKTHPENPRRGDTSAIAESIDVNGFYGAVVAQRATGFVLAGNHRLKAVEAAGGAEVPVIWLDVSDTEARRILLADNRTSDLGGYDDRALAELLNRALCDSGSLGGTGYDQVAFDKIIESAGQAILNAKEKEAAAGGGQEESKPAPQAEEDEAPEPDQADILLEKWKVQPGQIWTIGPHRLRCGDSTDAAGVAALLNGATPNLMVTDPPYGVEYSADWREQAGLQSGGAYGKVANDDRADWSDAWKLFPGTIAYVWHAAIHSGTVETSLKQTKFDIRSQIIWAKSRLVISRGHYHWQHEPCWYAVRKGATANWQSDRKQTTLWQIDKPQRSETGHSTQKPVECMARPMRHHLQKGESVYEPFSGSGTSFVAAEQLGMVCYGSELEPKYCAIILERMEKLGLKPELCQEHNSGNA